jgi:hypothetical protein
MAGSAAGTGLIVAAAVLAALLGLAPGALSVGGTVAIGILGLGALAILAFRQLVRTAQLERPSGLSGDAADTSGRSDPVLRLPRLLFYLGALLVTLSSARVGFGLTAGELCFIASFGLTFLAVLAGRPGGFVPPALVAGVAVFALGGLISSPNAASTTKSVIEVMQGVYVMLLWAWTGATVLRSRPQILTALSMFTASAAINGFGAFTQVTGATALAGPLEGSRATGFTVHANDLGGACAVALVVALMLATSRFPWQSATFGPLGRAARWAVLGLIASGLVLSGSVTAMLAAFVTIVIWLFAPAVRASGRLAVVMGVAFAMLAVMLVGGKVISPTERFGQVTTASGTRQGSGTANIRMRTVSRAMSRIERDPVVGAGFDGVGGVVNVIDKGRSTQYQVHSAPVAAWYEAGVLGFVGLLIVAVTLGRAAWRSLFGADEDDLLIGLAILASGTAFVIIALTSPLVFQQYGWFTAVMVVAWYARRLETAEVLVTTERHQGAERDQQHDRERAPRALPAAMPQPLTH